MSLKSVILLLSFCHLWSLPAKASAAQLLFALEGDQTISFTVDANPSPDSVVVDGFILSNVNVTIDGLSGLRDVGFVRQLSGGGLIILGTPIDLAGPQLFSGSLAQPTLNTGTFQLASFSDPAITYRLNVTPAGAVPEPGTWLLLLSGFGMAAAGLRCRQRRMFARVPVPA